MIRLLHKTEIILYQKRSGEEDKSSVYIYLEMVKIDLAALD